MKKSLKTYSQSLLFDLSAEELVELEKELNEIIGDLDSIKSIKTGDLEGANYPDNDFFTALREDVVAQTDKKVNYFSNAESFENDFVVVKYDK